MIDDEADVRLVANISLERVGKMRVLEASSGAEGIVRAKRDRPDLILLDMMMPGMDGAATFRALRASPETAGIPIIFLTAKAMLSEVQPLRQLGAKGVILKPFDPMTLAREIAAMLAA